MANQQVATQQNKQISIRDKLIQMTPEFKNALPGHIPPERFVRTVQTAIQMTPGLSQICSTPDGMKSLLAACTKAATDGLILDGREAALIPFGKMVQYIPMVAGLMKKARNSGDISSIAAHVVYKNDKFTYILGDDERIEHAPNMTGERGEPIAVYAIVRLKDGTVQREVMDKAAVMRIAAQSKNAGQYNPSTGKNYGEWWRKTVIRRISKYLPSSSDRDSFLQAVERIDEDFDYEAKDGGEVIPIQTAKKRGGAAAALKDVTPKQEEKPAEAAAVEQDEGVEEYDEDTGEFRDPQDPGFQEGDDI